MQRKFWDEMCQLKFELFYLEEYISNSYDWDKRINFITAIASSSSIGAWAVWNSLKFVWSSIIALSQVINAIKTQLPYSKRIKVLNDVYSEYSRLFIEFDYTWYKASNGDMSNTDINDTLKSLRTKKDKIDNKLLTINLPRNEKLVEKAMKNIELYYS